MMNLPAILRRDPVASKQEAARALLASAEGRIVSLEADRAKALLGDSLEDVGRIDRQLDEQRRAIVVYQDRLAALAVEQRRIDHEDLKAAAAAAIDKAVVPAVAEIERMARKFQSDLLALMDLYEQIHKKRDDLMVNWPAAAPRPQFGSLYLTAFGPQLFGHLRQGMRGSGMAFVQNVRFHANTMAADVAREAASFIEDARRTKVPKPESDNDEEAA
jgi:hypothetical protein